MFCGKCGKEIEDGSKYCPYCGRNIEEPPDDEWEEMDDSDIPSAKIGKRSWKKFVIPAGTVLGVAVIATVGVLAVNHGKEKSVDSKKVVSQENKSDKQDKTETEKQTGSDTTEISQTDTESEYPKDIILDADVQDKVIEFTHLLGKVDCRLSGGDGNHLGSRRIISTKGSTYFGFSFLFESLHQGVPFINGHEAEYPKDYSKDGSVIVSEDIVNGYLQNSINTTDYLYQADNGYFGCEINQGIVYLALADPNSMWNIEQPVIQKVAAVSENDIQVEGTILYKHPETGNINNTFEVTLTANPESMWGGYTLKEINSWEEDSTTAPTSDYVLPDIASLYYAESELSGMDAQGLYIARNELYARHGYIFNDQDLKQYFGAKSWYKGTTTTVPDGDFNKYEKANLDLILALEEKFK